MAKQAEIEIAYLRSGYIRVVQTGANHFEVQARRLRGERKFGTSPFWKKLYGVFDREKAIRLLESYA